VLTSGSAHRGTTNQIKAAEKPFNGNINVPAILPTGVGRITILATFLFVLGSIPGLSIAL